MKLSTLVLLLCLSIASVAKEPLVFGAHPSRDAKELKEHYAVLLSYLEKTLGREIVFLVSNDYAHLKKLIEQQSVHIAAVAPKMFASLRTQPLPYHYMATFKIIDNEGYKQSTYRSLILTHASSAIHTLKDIKGKTFGFTDPSSTSGYAYPRFAMQQAGINPEKDLGTVFMLKKHTKIISALLEGSIDAGATYENIVTALPEATREKIRILHTTEEIPYGAIIASESLDAATREVLRGALLAFESPQTHTNSIVGFEEKPLELYDRLLLLTE